MANYDRPIPTVVRDGKGSSVSADPDLELRGGGGQKPLKLFFGPSGLSLV